MAKAAGKADKPTIVIRKEEVIEGGHHGGAWKVAYADFVTAMMAFFLLMWLLNATTEEQRRGLADYFSPSNQMGRTTSGFGAPFGGRTPNLDGSMVSDRGAVQVVRGPPNPLVDLEQDETEQIATGRPQPNPGLGLPRGVRSDSDKPTRDDLDSPGGGDAADGTDGLPGRADRRMADRAADQGAGRSADPAKLNDAAVQAEAIRRERAQFEDAARQIREAVRNDPQLAEMAKQLAVDVTPDGLRIQVLDTEKQPMFPNGSAALSDRARALLAKLVPVLAGLPEQISISGHTDNAQYRGTGRSNWDLSSERANATRRLLTDSGLPEGRFRSVAGRADREPLLPADPAAATNRRVAIIVHKTAGR